MLPKKVIVIGSGFAGLAAACTLASKGYQVTILEKNATPGGRARQFSAEGFTFDMGPSWYWMPGVFEQFFQGFGKRVSDYYELVRLDPSYQVFFGKNELMRVPADMPAIEALFERYEPGSTPRLRQFLAEAEYKYRVGMGEFVWKPGHSLLEFADRRVLASAFRLQLLQSMSSHLRSLFRNDKLLQLLEFPVLFLGATPENTPALYSLMNYADLALGTWYPQGGMYRIVEAMVSLAQELGVRIELGREVRRLETAGGAVSEVVTTDGARYPADAVVATADYHHVETQLLAPEHRQYSGRYWDTRTLAPSCLLYYVGLNRRVEGLLHHNLFFDENFAAHARDIYTAPRWPDRPLFYACAPSQTDPSVAPPGCENLFLLIPVAPDLSDTPEIRTRYFHVVMQRLEALTGQPLREAVVFQRAYAHSDFMQDYHAFKGNAYGLANTLRQTAFLKPKLRSRKLRNLWYAGQLTTPGPGVPPSIISGQVAAADLIAHL